MSRNPLIHKDFPPSVENRESRIVDTCFQKKRIHVSRKRDTGMRLTVDGYEPTEILQPSTRPPTVNCQLSTVNPSPNRQPSTAPPAAVAGVVRTVAKLAEGLQVARAVVAAVREGNAVVNQYGRDALAGGKALFA